MPTPAEAIAAAHGIFEMLTREATAGAITADRLDDPRASPVGYWRKPDGWIRLGQYGFNSTESLVRGHQMLPRYGQFRPPGAAGAVDPLRNDPLLMLVKNGGAHELLPAQVQSLRWHRPPSPNARGSHKLLWEPIQAAIAHGVEQADAVEMALPQLKDTDWREWRDYKCQFCPQRVFNSSDEVARHESVMHREDVRTRELRDSIATALKEGGRQDGALLEALTTTMMRLAERDQESREQVAALIQAVAGAKNEEPKTRGRRGVPADDSD